MTGESTGESAGESAGQSADELSRRAREKAERLLRHAEMYEKGAAGERAVQDALAALGPEWTVFHDVRWPGRPRANIDHVVIGPGGVFVIDAKNWSGAVIVRGGVLRQNGYVRAAAVDGVRQAARAIAGLAPAAPASTFVPVLCFVGEGAVEAEIDGVLACRLDSLVPMLTSHPVTLSPELLRFLRYDLDMSMHAAAVPAPARERPPAPGAHGLLDTSPASPPGPPRPAAYAGPRAPSRPARRSRAPGRASRPVMGLLIGLLIGVMVWWLGCLVVWGVLSAAGLSRQDHPGVFAGGFFAAGLVALVVVRRVLRA